MLAVLKKQFKEPKEKFEGALKMLLPYQRKDFIGIFTAMAGLPVTIRLLDPPLHEFLPQDAKSQQEMARRLKVKPTEVKDKVEELHEFNPMLGHRGCRLTITYPEIARMQARAIMEAAIAVAKKKKKVLPEIMIPLVGTVKELAYVKEHVVDEINKVFKARKTKVPYLVGTMIEVPRAALTADEVAAEAEFFSFGTNDLTQMTMGFSRDDAGKFLGDYVAKSIYDTDPFQSLDQTGVGKLVETGIKLGRKSRDKLKIGICGEHGGDPASIAFCHKVGMNYVSCSPFRVPIARLAAAQAALKKK
jgi:pyruvate,orthophosphate dikinase